MRRVGTYLLHEDTLALAGAGAGPREHPRLPQPRDQPRQDGCAPYPPHDEDMTQFYGSSSTRASRVDRNRPVGSIYISGGHGVSGEVIIVCLFINI
eukprot:4737923-Pyramimonas_sp.AAC.2